MWTRKYGKKPSPEECSPRSPTLGPAWRSIPPTFIRCDTHARGLKSACPFPCRLLYFVVNRSIEHSSRIVALDKCFQQVLATNGNNNGVMVVDPKDPGPGYILRLRENFLSSIVFQFHIASDCTPFQQPTFTVRSLPRSARHFRPLVGRFRWPIFFWQPHTLFA